MTQDIAEHLRKISSRNGRYWLRDSRHGEVGAVENRDDLPFGSVKRSEPDNRTLNHQSVVVSIPDVTVARQAAVGNQQGTRVSAPVTSVQQVPPTPHSFTRAKLNATMPKLAPVTTSQSVPSVGKPQQAVATSPNSGHVSAAQFANLAATEVKTPATPVAPSVAPAPLASPPSPPSPPKQLAAPSPQEDDAVKAARSTQSNGIESSIVKIADEILANYPVASSSVIMFSGSQSALHCDETCARVSAELASRNLGRVLLIDSDFDSRRLTKASGMSSQGGLSEIMNIAYPWQDAILKSGSSKLDFMAAGNCPHKRWTPKRLLREALAEVRNEYQFVCVSAGEAHGSAAALWSELSDGVLLVVSASQSSEAIAQSAVGQLKASGARMLGCVVADCR
jgi:Mrp family chromosome partitioning ATPase